MSWYDGADFVHNSVASLITGANETKEALLALNTIGEAALEKLGTLLTTYCSLKTIISETNTSSQVIPDNMAYLMNELKPYCYGSSFAGAGGGGFFIFLTKEHKNKQVVPIIKSNQDSHEYELYDVSIDTKGCIISSSSELKEENNEINKEDNFFFFFFLYHFVNLKYDVIFDS